MLPLMTSEWGGGLTVFQGACGKAWGVPVTLLMVKMQLGPRWMVSPKAGGQRAACAQTKEGVVSPGYSLWPC